MRTSLSFLLVVVMLLGLSSCRHYVDLPLVDENTIREYYKDDPQGYAAVRFLLKNISYHYSFEGNIFGDYCNAIDSVFLFCEDSEQRDELRSIKYLYDNKLRLEPDASIVDTDFLIKNVDLCLNQWRTSPWLNHLTMEDFLEYYLPYKCVEGQPLDYDWKKDADLSWLPDLAKLNREDNNYYRPRARYYAVHNFLLEKNPMADTEPDLEVLPLIPSVLSHAIGASCYGRSYAEMMYLRANQVPVTVDFTPSWVMRQGGHAWLSLFSSNRHNQPLESWTVNVDPGYFRENCFPLAKVYRIGWSPRKLLLKAANAGVLLTRGLSYYFVKDVTDEYCKTADITVKSKQLGGYVYISLFDGQSWVPIDISRSILGFVRFKHMAKDVTYCLTSVKDGGQLSSPFRLTSEGKLVFFDFDSTFEPVRLTRTFPVNESIFYHRNTIGGISLYSSMNGTAYAPVGVSDSNSLVAGSLYPCNETMARYIKATPVGNEGLDLAEIYIYSEDSSIVGCRPSGFFSDNDPLTYSRITKEDELLLDIGEAISIDHISFIKRGDGNDIIPGDIYELYYNNGRSWELLDRVLAKDIFIESIAPVGALLWLKDITRGTESSLFVYNGGLQKWM